MLEAGWRIHLQMMIRVLFAIFLFSLKFQVLHKKHVLLLHIERILQWPL